MKNNLNVLFLSLFITSCGGYNKNKDFRLQDGGVIDDGMSVVIIGIGETIINNKSFRRDAPPQKMGQMEWCNVETGKCFFMNPYDSRDGIQILQVLALGSVVGTAVATHQGKYVKMEDKYNLYKIKPGKYYLKEFNFVVGLTGYGKWDKNKKQTTLASFEVKPNEIVYLGDINFNICYYSFAKNKIHIYIADTIESVLSGKYFFNRKIETKLIQIGTYALDGSC